MQTGNPVIITDSQNHILHAQTHLQKGAELAQAVQQGADPQAIAQYFGLLIPHIEEHLSMLAGDEAKKAEVKQLQDQLKELAGFANEVANQVTQQLEQQQAQQQAAAQQPPQPSLDEQLKVSSLEREEARKDAVLQAELQRNDLKLKQELALADAKAASSL